MGQKKEVDDIVSGRFDSKSNSWKRNFGTRFAQNVRSNNFFLNLSGEYYTKRTKQQRQAENLFLEKMQKFEDGQNSSQFDEFF